MVRNECDETLVTKVDRRLDELKKRTDFFFNYYDESIDIDLKNLLKGVVKNSYELFGRISECDENIIETFNLDFVDLMLQRIQMYDKRHIRNEIFSYDLIGARILVNAYLNYNAKILKMELENSLTDGGYRYPRCPHVNKQVEHVLYVDAEVYSKEKKDSPLLFLICDECNDYFEYCFEMYDWIGENECFCILGYEFRKPLNFSMY